MQHADRSTWSDVSKVEFRDWHFAVEMLQWFKRVAMLDLKEPKKRFAGIMCFLGGACAMPFPDLQWFIVSREDLERAAEGIRRDRGARCSGRYDADSRRRVIGDGNRRLTELG